MKQVSKRTVIITAAAAVLLCAIIAGVIFMFFGRNLGNKPEPIGEITQFESLTLHISGMRGSEEYEIIADGGTAQIAHYQIRYGGEGENRELLQSAECDTQEVIDILNECKAGKWNGFHGAHPKGVLDGTMFNLTASVNGGKKLKASGSQNFPKNYGTFT